jgi:hypothetical protein
MEYNCEKCKYKTYLKQNYNKHILSERHKVKQTSTEECYEHTCIKCNKLLLSKTSVWRHAKICDANLAPKNTVIEKTDTETKELLQKILEGQTVLANSQTVLANGQTALANENKMLKQLVIELSKNPSNIINSNNTNNTNNNNFNMNFFLNEQCKNAVNITDFIKSLTVELQTLQNIENKGYVNGMTDCIVENLKKYSLYNRPIHYITDNEEKTVQIRDEDEWKQDSKWLTNSERNELEYQKEEEAAKNATVLGHQVPEVAEEEDEEDEDGNEKQESMLATAIFKIDQKVFETFETFDKEVNKKSKNKILKKILSDGVYLKHRNNISGKVLNNVQINGSDATKM